MGSQVDNAVELVEAIKPPWTDIQRTAYLDRMMEDGLSKGLTGVHDARVQPEDARYFKRY